MGQEPLTFLRDGQTLCQPQRTAEGPGGTWQLDPGPGGDGLTSPSPWSFPRTPGGWDGLGWGNQAGGSPPGLLVWSPPHLGSVPVCIVDTGVVALIQPLKRRETGARLVKGRGQEGGHRQETAGLGAEPPERKGLDEWLKQLPWGSLWLAWKAWSGPCGSAYLRQKTPPAPRGSPLSPWPFSRRHTHTHTRTQAQPMPNSKACLLFQIKSGPGCSPPAPLTGSGHRG